jgi:transcriptional regulator with XRE-family HTH domain
MEDAHRTTRSPLGRLLQERREELGYSRARAGEAVGIRPGTIEGWELGRVAKPPIQDVLRLARFLGLSAEEVEQAALGPPPEHEPPAPPAGNNSRIGAVPLLEQAIELFGWTDEQAAAALDRTPETVRSWRSGSLAMTLPEIMSVAALIGLAAAAAAGGGEARIAALADVFGRARTPSAPSA